MKFSLRKNLKLTFLIALPLILFAMVRDKASWRPQSINTPRYTSEIAISPDDQLFAYAFASEPDNNSKVFVSELQSDKVAEHWQINHIVDSSLLRDGNTLAFSPDGKMLAMAWSVIDMGTLQSLGVSVRDEHGKIRELQPIKNILSEDYPQQLRFSPDGKTIWLASLQNLRAWNLSSGKLQWQWRSGDLRRYPETSLVSVAISTDCRFYFRYNEESYLVWDIARNQLAMRLNNKPYGAGLRFSPDASSASYSYSDSKLSESYVVIDTRTGRELWRPAGREEPWFAGDKVVFSQENKFKVCNARTGKFLYELPAKPQSYVLPAASIDWLYTIKQGGDYFRQRFR